MKQVDAVILANGEYPVAPLPLSLLEEAPYVACCDGGADAYIAHGYVPDIIIGDGDSLSEENRKRFAGLIHYNPDQETNDQTKAVTVAFPAIKMRSFAPAASAFFKISQASSADTSPA